MSSSSALKQLLVRMRATHFEFINKNDLYYSGKGVRKGVKSWTKPYPNPQLVAHNKMSDPIGRIIDYKVRRNKDLVDEPQNFVELISRITDREAIEKILDGRYYTVSVGSRCSRVICSECKQVLSVDGLCEHKKGTFNDRGERVHWIIDEIEYVENSFVNEPADEYARIVEINLGKGWIDYNDFLENKENYINVNTEDSMPKNLTSKARNALPDSSFGFVATQDEKKIRKFPVHDAAHVRNCLTKLSDAELPETAKNRILACLKRRAERFDIKVNDEFEGIEWDEIEDTYGIDEEWSEDDVQAVSDLFEEDPNFDLIEGDEGETQDQNQNEETTEESKSSSKSDSSSMKKAELVDLVAKLQKDLEDAKSSAKADVEVRDSKIEKLEDKVQKLTTQNLEKEDEINKYTDKVAVLTSKYKNAVVQNIIDLKMTDNNSETRDDLSKKFSDRKLESLQDSLEDLRLESKKVEIEHVEDPTVGSTEDEVHKETLNDEAGVKDPRFKLFVQDRS